MARQDRAAKKAAKAAKKGGPSGGGKALKKARGQWQSLEAEIEREFAMLAREGYDPAELATLRWDYRYDKLPRFKLTREQLEYFVAELEARASGRPPPPPPGALAGPQAMMAPAWPEMASPEYTRKSEVDLALVEKYLERRVSRDTRAELESVYRQAFGEDLVVPKGLDLVDYTYRASEVQAADKRAKLSKAEILGVREEAKPEAEPEAEAAPEAVQAVAAAPVAQAKGPPRSLGLLMAWKTGVPKRPTYDEKWWILHPLRFWVFPKRMAKESVGAYYAVFLVNLAILILQIFPGFLIPLVLRFILWGSRYLWLRLLKPHVAPAMKAIKEKAAVPPATPSEPEKKPTGAKTS